jgi:serine/threonine-protein kinase RsbW
VDGVLSEAGVDAECRDDLQLAVAEACANVVGHAGGGDFDVRLTIGDGRCVVEVADCGPGLGTRSPSELALPEDREAEAGRGLAIIRAVTDGLELQPRDPHGLTVRLTKILA